MSSFYRSTEMGYYNLVIPHESAWFVMNELAELDCLHFDDQDPSRALINRQCANYVRRCDETLQKLQQIESEMKNYDKQIQQCDSVKNLLASFKRKLRNREKPFHTYFEEIESEINQKFNALQAQMKNLTEIQTQYELCIEERAVLSKGNELLGQQFFQQQRQEEIQSEIEVQGFGGLEQIRNQQVSLRFSWMVGVIDKIDEQRFKRIIFRVTKGNAWVNIIDISGQELGQLNVENKVLKCVFVIVFAGGQQNNGPIQSKLNRVIDAFNPHRYDFPNTQQGFTIRLNAIEQKLEDSKKIIELTRSLIDQQLGYFLKVSIDSNCSLIEEYHLYVTREKYLYTHLNMMKMQGSIFYANLWMPKDKLGTIEMAFQNFHNFEDNLPKGQINPQPFPNDKQPPTFLRLTKVTAPFQEIVNTYGVPRYQEVNPGLFTIATFPFLFAVMFGDIGHGGLLLILGLYLVYFKKYIEKSDSIFKPLIVARYLILLMGFFAFYCGFIYNDFMSISFNLFGSCYELNGQSWNKIDNCVYLIGIDPVWSVSNNELAFLNSFKMKLAVTIAVIHMLFGVILKGVNSIFFNNYIDFVFEFIPQFLFLTCTFGFMVFMIIFKWLNVYDPSLAPSIITTMINMTLTPTQIQPYPLWGDGESQRQISILLLLIAILCVPWMLFPKPLILDELNKTNDNYHQLQEQSQDDDVRNDVIELQDQSQENERRNQIIEYSRDETDEKIIDIDSNLQAGQQIKIQKKEEVGYQEKPDSKTQHHDFSELFVHQVIETIEFVLGSISNTASYLRLWALSLAHGQLAEVFFDMTIASSIKEGGVTGSVGVIFGFTIFACATLGVLMMMDVMECFLHALRLHWVEFQNKFYKADGYLFTPFSYTYIISKSIEEKQK